MGGDGATLGGVALLAVVAALAFLVGSLNPATLLARVLGRDLRHSGSGNPGATNVGRVLGVRWGVLVGVLDVAKGYLPAAIALHVAGLRLALVAGLAAVLGHIFSPFLGGRGGKGVATALGAMLAIEAWFALVGVLGFLLAIRFVRTVGEASVVACVLLLLTGIGVAAGVLGFTGDAQAWWLVVTVLVVLARHRRNVSSWWARRAR